MKYVMLLYTDRESNKAEKLKDYLQGRLRNMADLRSIGEISAEEGDFRSELRSRGDCIVLVGSRHASYLIKAGNKRRTTISLHLTGRLYMKSSQETKNLLKN